MAKKSYVGREDEAIPDIKAAMERIPCRVEFGIAFDLSPNGITRPSVQVYQQETVGNTLRTRWVPAGPSFVPADRAPGVAGTHADALRELAALIESP